MNDYTILKLRSSTDALKASSILSLNKIDCKIFKTVTSTEGCIYSLKIYTDFQKALSVLDKQGILYTVSENESAVAK
ncbi:MAG: hypothetical protein E7510_08175 [Ruminococcus sp.]|nr:hypothetical protein [Ruminococcus sp.]